MRIEIAANASRLEGAQAARNVLLISAMTVNTTEADDWKIPYANADKKSRNIVKRVEYLREPL